MKKVIMGNHAVSWGAKLARTEVISAYPITPQTQIVEELSEMCADGRLDAKFIKVESEHSAMAACIGASATGVRAFTATSAQGLALMHELLHWAALGRHPIVMADINRAMAPGWSIWTDQNDSLSQRDTGWIQLYCETNQEVLDTTIQAFKLAEAVDLPVMIILDAFFLSHTSEPVDIPDQDVVDVFLPKREARYKLDTDDPRAFGALARPDVYMEMRLRQQEAMEEAREVMVRVEREWEELTGRGYGPIESFKAEDAELLLVTSGTITSTSRHVVNELRAEGQKVGLVKVKMFRPFPTMEIRGALANVPRVAVLDRNISPGHGGIFAEEIRSALYDLPAESQPALYGYVLGLGGRDVTPEVIRGIVDEARTAPVPERRSLGGGELMSQTMIKDQVPQEDLIDSGHLACPGCGAPIAMRMVLKVLGPKTIITLPACCWSIIAGPYPQSSVGVPLYHTAFETGASLSSGIRAALDVRGDRDTTVLVWAGDGGTFDIGIQALSGAAERNEDILYCCYDNEAYMNTGVQRSSSTPWGAWTTTTPGDHPESHPKKDMIAILAAHRVPYAATASVAYPVDLLEKVKKAKSIRGTRFLQILSPCPPGWKCADEDALQLARMAVRARLFPLMEVENGETWRLTVDHPGDPVEPYLRKQGRFRHLNDEQIARIQTDLNTRWKALERRVQFGT